RLNLAESAFQAKDFDEVTRLLEPLIGDGAKVEPRLVQSALYRLGRTQVERKDWAGAGRTFGRLVAEYPDGAFRREAQFWKAEVAFQSGDAKEAEAGFAALVAEPPADGGTPEAWVQTARLRRIQALARPGRPRRSRRREKSTNDSISGPKPPTSMRSCGPLSPATRTPRRPAVAWRPPASARPAVASPPPRPPGPSDGTTVAPLPGK